MENVKNENADNVNEEFFDRTMLDKTLTDKEINILLEALDAWILKHVPELFTSGIMEWMTCSGRDEDRQRVKERLDKRLMEETLKMESRKRIATLLKAKLIMMLNEPVFEIK